jgi:hypothetical protein
VRLVEFLIALLEAHAETLKRLAALFGEENLIQLLEMAGDEDSPSSHPSSQAKRAAAPPIRLIQPSYFDAPSPFSATDSTYAELEGAVREMNLPAFLEFHLWAYPHYRAFIESPIDLNSRIPGPGGEAGVALVDEAVTQAEAWVKGLPMSELVRDQASRAAHVPWLKFRTQVLKRIGKRPLGPVY